LLVALWNWRQLLTAGGKGFDDCRYAGAESGAEILETSLGSVESRWRFAREGGLIGGESQVAVDGGPCDVVFAGARRDSSGRQWPARMTIGVDGKTAIVFDVERVEIAL
jgi:hypothetical protein